MTFSQFPRVMIALLVSAWNILAQEPVISPTLSPAPQVLTLSPDGKFLVQRERAESGAHGEARKRLEICSKSGTVLYAWESELGVTTLLWSPNSRYLAVNDMPGVQGDLVRVFALNPLKPEVTSVREPNGKKLLLDEEKQHGTFLSSVDQVMLRASEWREGRLWCLLTGSVHSKREPMVHILFRRMLVYGFRGTDFPMMEEEWTRTLPKGCPMRDQ